MPARPQSEARAVFGPFEVNAGELLRGGVRVRLSGQPFQILLLLLAKPGETITREELRDHIWSDGTFVDFEHGLNAAMNKLRRALSDTAENPRYIETVPGRGYRFIGAVQFLEPAGRSAATSETPEGPASRSRMVPRLWLASGAACIVVCLLLLVWHFQRQNAEIAPLRLIRLTADAGLTDAPALSPDGKLVAYSSDRDGGKLDLYIQQIAGGLPVRLTSDGSGNTAPDFSPDGTRLVFRSNRAGGGIYEIPALGGTARLVAREGRDPKFSPDGSQVAYWVGTESLAPLVPKNGTVWVVPAAAGQPQQIGSGFTTARHPIWAPDGKHILLVGYTSAIAYESTDIDWWLVATNGNSAVRTGAYRSFAHAGLQPSNDRGFVLSLIDPIPGCWSAADNTVIFSIATGDTRNLWEITAPARNGEMSGEVRRLTTGAGNELYPSCAFGGALTFANRQTTRDVWLANLDPAHAVPQGGLQRSAGGPQSRDPFLSGDGRFMLFDSDQSGRVNIWKRDILTGNESIVAPSPLSQRFPVADATGERIAFSVYEKEQRAVYVSTGGGTAEKVCDGCLRATDWSRDANQLLVFEGNPYQVDILDLASHQKIPLLKHLGYDILYARFSPDNRWVSFTARFEANRGRIAIAPLDGHKSIAESNWITIADAGIDDYANWSPDGGTLYFTSARDGFNCVWGQRIDPVHHQPEGDPFAVLHVHGRATFPHLGWSVGGNRIGLSLAETTGNVWMLSRSGAR